MTFDTPLYKKVDYQRVYCAANEILLLATSISSFPFKASALVREFSDVRLCKFSKAIDQYHIPIHSFGSDSAVILEQNGAYILFYNQDEPAYRIRFSILHELGHYYLGHQFDLPADSERYQIQEMEANAFAAQILMPEQLLRECQSRGRQLTISYLMQSFGVSEYAAQKRIATLARTTYEWRSRAEREFDDYIMEKFVGTINKSAPVRVDRYVFESEYERQRDRDSWLTEKWNRR